jgi:vacuole morphology and inheritance protein 14
LSEFLREIKYIADVQEKQADTERQTRERRQTARPIKQKMKDIGEEADTALDTDEEPDDVDEGEEWEGEGSGAWVPGQGVVIDYSAIMDIIIQHLSYPGKPIPSRQVSALTILDELVQSTAMEWILTFLDFAQNTVISFTPRIVPAILPNLASPQYVQLQDPSGDMTDRTAGISSSRRMRPMAAYTGLSNHCLCKYNIPLHRQSVKHKHRRHHPEA